MRAEGAAQHTAVVVAAWTAAAAIAAIYLLLHMVKRPSSLRGKHALVTGGSEGIGLAVAHELVLRGARVSLIARTQAKLDCAAEQLGGAAAGPPVHTAAADVTDADQARRRACHAALP
jgi:3-dehydrosphinganine reductase